MQQGAGTSGGGGGGGSQSQYGDLTQAAASAPALSVTFSQTNTMPPDQSLAVEVASPISSRPPATANLEELMRLSSAAVTAGGGGEEEAGASSGNRWPRQETLALLKIRSDMDAVFRDATIKGPLWEDVSRKMEELGYKKRSGKKCKEKFENVHKYYKRTKEGRGARQDGKTYKFFTELEALHNTTPPLAIGPPPQPTLDVAPVSVGLPIPIAQPVFNIPPATISVPAAPRPNPTSTNPPPVNMSFSSDTNSASHESSDYDDMDEDEMASGSRKRKRESSGKMMEFFESLMKQVMQKQERMQKMFLEAIEKREQDRMIREEAWKRQETARLQREHDLMAQERANSASRDAAILSFIHKFTGQTIQLPTVSAPIPPPPAAAPPPPQVVTSPQPPSTRPPRQSQPQQQQQHSQIQRQFIQPPNPTPPPPPVSSELAVVVVPEQPPEDIGGSEAASSSRWPKPEVLALINLRSGLENRYQESGPKGPLWEEISAGMLGLGYRRNAKRCKEKWENINKYYKKVKESRKKRPEDSKTCPYFHQLDALYQRKLIGNTPSGGSGGAVTTQPPILAIMPSQQQQQHQHQENVNLNQQPPSNADIIPTPSSEMENKNGGSSSVAAPGNLFGEGTTNKPEAIVKGLMMGQQQQGMEHMRSVLMDDENEEMDSYDMDEDEEDEDDELEGNNNNKMGNYKIEYQRPNTSNSNAGPNSFLAMVQ